jgi:hypothetical protein
MKKLLALVVGLLLVLFVLTMVTSTIDLGMAKYSDTPQFASTPPIKPPPVPKVR